MSRGGKKAPKPELKQQSLKKPILILSAVALVLILAAGGLIWGLLSMLPRSQTATVDVETYFSQHWTAYQFRSWDPETGLLELDYPQNATYAQMEKYGAELDFSRDALDQLQNLQSIRMGVREACGISPRQVLLHGISSDGLEVYTVDTDGGLTACWENPTQP